MATVSSQFVVFILQFLPHQMLWITTNILVLAVMATIQLVVKVVAVGLAQALIAKADLLHQHRIIKATCQRMEY